MAPHGVYPCHGDDSWISIAVAADTEWQTLCNVVGQERWKRDVRFQTQDSRWRHRAELDELLPRWTACQNAWDLAERLQASGVAAAPVMRDDDLMVRDDLPTHGFHDTVDHPRVQRVPGPAARLNGETPPIRYIPPDLGAHTDELLSDLLDMTDDDLSRLREEGVI